MLNHSIRPGVELLDLMVVLDSPGEGNANPLQCSCLETPRDGGSQPTPVFLPGESWGQRSPGATVGGVTESRTWLCTSMILLLFTFEAPPCRFAPWLHRSAFPPTAHEGSLSSTRSPTFVTSRLADKSHSDGCELIPHCGFEFHLEKEIWSRVFIAAWLTTA